MQLLLNGEPSCCNRRLCVAELCVELVRVSLEMLECKMAIAFFCSW